MESKQISISFANGISSIGTLAITLLENMSVIILLAYLLTRTQYFTNVLNKKFTVKSQIILILVFGGFSIYGTYSGFEFFGAIANVRDLAPMIGGLIGGPIVGIAAGLIGATHRYFLGGFTVVPCTIATVLAGLLGGVIFLANKGKFVGVVKAGIFAFLMESLHMTMALFLAQPFSVALTVVQSLSFPMIFANTLGMVIFGFIITNRTKEIKTAEERDKYLLELERKKQELKIASDIQKSFLPETIPKIEGIDLSATNLSALEVGGDFYDFIPIASDKWGFLIADVSGKGIPAALFMALSRTLIHASATGNSSVANSIKQANRLIYSDAKSGSFVTLFYGILDSKKMSFTYVNAGHNPPILLNEATKDIVLLKAKGIALGAIEEVELQEVEVKLRQGDIVILYTDGVTEAMNERNEQFGLERLTKVVNHNRESPAQDIIKKIENEINSFVKNQPQFDDLTIMILKTKKQATED